MLVWGTANPEGMHPDYRGVFLTTGDIKDMVQQFNEAVGRGEKIPVHLEHKGNPVGRVVSAWEHENTMQCVLELDKRVLEGSIGSEFVKDRIIKDLSLGYSVDVSCSKKEKGKFFMDRKLLKEISLVKKGARPRCHVHGFC
jgi:hypothetical protein